MTKNSWKTPNHHKMRSKKNPNKIHKPNPQKPSKIQAKRFSKLMLKTNKKMRPPNKSIKTIRIKKIMKKKWRKSQHKKIRKNRKNLWMRKYWILSWANFTSWPATFINKTSPNSLCQCALLTTQLRRTDSR